MKPQLPFSLILLSILLFTGLPLQLAAGADDSPNFVGIMTDDQSWGGSSVLMDPDDDRTRSDYFQTPHIERLAKLGMQFTQGYSQLPTAVPHDAVC